MALNASDDKQLTGTPTGFHEIDKRSGDYRDQIS